MESPQENYEEPAEENIESEIVARQYRENLKMQEALKKQQEWRNLIEE